MAPGSEIAHNLRLLPCLSGMPEREISGMARLARLKTVEKSQRLFEESAPVEFFFILVRGTVKLHKTSHEGRELIVRIMGPNDYFCCAPLYSGRGYHVGATALEDSSLVLIPAKNFREALRGEVGEAGWKMVLNLCNRINDLSRLLEDLTFKGVEERVLAALLKLAEEKGPQTGVVSLRLTHQDIASLTGTVREVVSRTMSRLKREGTIVESNVRGFKLDKDRLRQLLRRQDSLP